MKKAWKVCRRGFAGKYLSVTAQLGVWVQYVIDEKAQTPFGPPSCFDSRENASLFVGALNCLPWDWVILECDAEEVEPVLGMCSWGTAAYLRDWWRGGRKLDNFTSDAPKCSVWAYGLVPRREVA